MDKKSKETAVAVFFASPADELILLAVLFGISFLTIRYLHKQTVPVPTLSVGGQSTTSDPEAEKKKIVKWLLGLGGVWIILSILVDLGDTAEFAVALALVLAGSVVIQNGGSVFENLGISTSATGS